jgi:protein-tyrosine phosphatase
VSSERHLDWPDGSERHLDWPGAVNVRDLGGLPTSDGRRTRRGAVVRADSLGRLTAEGWQALADHGVRTVVDLRNDDECAADPGERPPGLRTHHLPLDNLQARDFWEDAWESGPQFGTPLYYRAHILRFPERSARVLAAIARAEPGGVVFHCMGGRDRTGQIAMLALHLVGVPTETICADYELSHARLSALFAQRGEDDESEQLLGYLRQRGTSAAEVIATTLSSIDVEGQLRAGGLTDEDLAALRERLIASPSEVDPAT